jgi:acetylornithine deacetylase/succinyl-diaminopimelate desuccinylase-like protein
MRHLASSDSAALDRAIASRFEGALTRLEEWLRIPSVSTLPEHAADCRRAAEWLGQRLRELGLRVALRGSRTHPVVVADGPRSPGAPTVVVYGHYDVQPPDPLDAWTTPPFEPSRRRGAIYARGATDDKGQVLAVLEGYAVAAAAGAPFQIRFLVEGQEESGGAVLASLLRERPELVAADAVLVSDTAYPVRGWPAIEVGVRGLCYVEIEVRTLRSDLHSGLFGGVAPNAHETLVRMLARLESPTGRIHIPGFYASVRRPGARERRGWKQLPFDQGSFLRDEVGARALDGPARRSVFERLWAMPSLDIHGITGGFMGSGVKTVIPAEARAKLSLRLVPDQRHRDALAQLWSALRALAPPHAEVRCRLLAGADPVLVDTGHASFADLDRAFREVEGRPATFVRSGGSLPILAALGQRGAAVLLTGIGLTDDAAHAPDEKLGIDQLRNGIRVFARFFTFLARRGARR